MCVAQRAQLLHLWLKELQWHALHVPVKSEGTGKPSDSTTHNNDFLLVVDAISRLSLVSILPVTGY